MNARKVIPYRFLPALVGLFGVGAEVGASPHADGTALVPSFPPAAYFSQDSSRSSVDRVVASIRLRLEALEAMSDRFAPEDFNPDELLGPNSLPGNSTVTAFRDGEQLVRVVTAVFGQAGSESVEYWFDGNNLIFIKAESRSTTSTGALGGTAGYRLYYASDTLVRAIDDAGMIFDGHDADWSAQAQSIHAFGASFPDAIARFASRSVSDMASEDSLAAPVAEASSASIPLPSAAVPRVDTQAPLSLDGADTKWRDVAIALVVIGVAVVGFVLVLRWLFRAIRRLARRSPIPAHSKRSAPSDILPPDVVSTQRTTAVSEASAAKLSGAVGRGRQGVQHYVVYAAVFVFMYLGIGGASKFVSGALGIPAAAPDSPAEVPKWIAGSWSHLGIYGPTGTWSRLDFTENGNVCMYSAAASEGAWPSKADWCGRFTVSQERYSNTGNSYIAIEVYYRTAMGAGRNTLAIEGSDIAFVYSSGERERFQRGDNMPR